MYCSRSSFLSLVPVVSVAVDVGVVGVGVSGCLTSVLLDIGVLMCSAEVCADTA